MPASPARMPKSASAASAQAKVCAAAIVDLLAGSAPETPRLISTCYNTVAPDYGILARRRLPAQGRHVCRGRRRRRSPVDAPREVRAREAADAERWFKTITAETFG